MTAVSIQQCCYHHAGREAVARCPVCGHFFCRECVTEHDDRMLCSTCLLQLSDAHAGRGRRWMDACMAVMQGAFGVALLWYLFYLIGQMLLSIPNTFHEGTIWQSGWWHKP
jgi:hypothetical protein